MPIVMLIIRANQQDGATAATVVHDAARRANDAQEHGRNAITAALIAVDLKHEAQPSAGEWTAAEGNVLNLCPCRKSMWRSARTTAESNRWPNRSE